MQKKILANRYEIHKQIGEGSFSIVYKGWDDDRGVFVAIKELKTTGISKTEAAEAQEIFFREIDFLKNLKHPVIPTFYDFIFEDDRHFLIMEWIDGTDLLEVIEKKGPIHQDEALYYMKQISDALIYMQRKNKPVIFKDLKPGNIMVTEQGNVKIIDFGTARYFSADKDSDTFALGTPGYAPPEAYGSEQTDLSADIYSVGATFFHVTTGEEPFQFKFTFPQARSINPNLSVHFSDLLAKCLVKKDERIPNAKDLKIKIDECYRKATFFKTPNSRLSTVFIVALIFSVLSILTTSSIFAGCAIFTFGTIAIAGILFPVYIIFGIHRKFTKRKFPVFNWGELFLYGVAFFILMLILMSFGAL